MSFAADGEECRENITLGLGMRRNSPFDYSLRSIFGVEASVGNQLWLIIGSDNRY